MDGCVCVWGGGGVRGGGWGGVCLKFYKSLEVIRIYAEVKKATHNRYTRFF